MNPDEFDKLLSRLADQDLSQEELTKLESHLSSSPEARETYLDWMDLETMFELEALSHQHALSTPNVIPFDTIIKRQQKRVALKSALAAVAIIALIGIVLQLVLVPNNEPMLSYHVSEGTQLELSHANPKEAPEGMAMEKGSRMKLTQGTVELTLASGVKSIIKAPADFTLTDEKKLHLDHGIAWFEVAEEGKGFIVETPTLTVTDYGTEFGIISGHDHPDEVHLLKGKVEVTSRHSLKNSEVLSGSTARRIETTGKLKEVDLQPQVFLKQLPEGLPHLLHWSFDNGLQPEGYHPEAQGIQVKPVGSPELVEGRIGKALSLNGSHQCLETDWEGIEAGQPCTVGFWFKIPKEGHRHNGAEIIAWGNSRRPSASGQWKISLVAPGSAPRIRLQQASVTIFTQTPLIHGKWTHIAIASTGILDSKGIPQTDIYLDGQLQETTLSKLHRSDAPATSSTFFPLVMGCDLYSRNQNFLKGEIDELYIYEKALNAEEIQKLLVRSQ